ncbi:MAG TPA: hypothetical protein VGV61_18235 [Thermoanaerobaculia bacterium]|jgi:hypothetical protein|nr:hypothetical protein [Thermoanaerobaculia bacterium]
MLVRYVLLTLPIHRRSFAEYYEEHDEDVRARQAEVEREWGGQPFEELPPHIRIGWKDRWYWPPWFFNDIVGYLKIGSDAEAALLADVFVERRHFPHTAPERFSRRGSGEADDREIIFLASLERRPVTLGDNASYAAACDRLVEDGRQTVRQQGHGLPKAEVWLPGFDLSCFDLARADQQLRERFPGRTDPR